MKLQEFRKLIREEISKLITEATAKPIEPTKLQMPNSDLDLFSNVKKKYKTKLLKQVTNSPQSKTVYIYQVIDTPYIVTNAYIDSVKQGPPEQRGLIFKSTDLENLISAIKNGSYFDLGYKDAGKLSHKASDTAEKVFKSKKYVMIDKNTKLKVGDNLLGIYKGAFAEIVKIVGDKYFLQYDQDFYKDKPIPKSFSVLRNNYLIKAK
jgi:hypothetical protein